MKIIDALYDNDAVYDYPISYSWNITRRNDDECANIDDKREQKMRIDNFEECKPNFIEMDLLMSTSDKHNKTCNISLVFYESPLFGIDFGTTYSCISFQRKQKNDNYRRNTIIVDHKNNQKCIHSAIYFTKNKTTLIGEDALKYLETDKENVIYDIKRIIGRNVIHEEFKQTHSFKINDDNKSIFIPNWNKSVTFEDTVAIILAYLVETASVQWANDDSNSNISIVRYFPEVIVSVPALFHTGQRNAIRRSCILAGLKLKRLSSEPSLGAVAFAYSRNDDENIYNLKSFLSFDFGGGTLDCAIISCTGKQCIVLDVHGNGHLGGIDFDAVIQDIIEEKLRIKEIDDTQIEEMKPRIQIKAEKVKIGLSNSFHEEIKLKLINGTTIEIILNKNEFVQHKKTQKLIDATINVIKELKAKMKKQLSIRAVLMIGGTSKIPFIKSTLQLNLPEILKVSDSIPFFESDIDEQLMPVTGAGIIGGTLNFEQTSWANMLIDVAPMPYGFAICEANEEGKCPAEGGCFTMKKVSKRGTVFNTTLFPIEMCQKKASATQMTLDIYEGDDDDVRNNYFLGQMVIYDIKPRQPFGGFQFCGALGNGNILLEIKISNNGSLIYTPRSNPIFDIILEKYKNAYPSEIQMIQKELYSSPPSQMYSDIKKHLDKKNKPYPFELIIDNGTDQKTYKVNITQHDMNMNPGKIHPYTINAEEEICIATSFDHKIEENKSLFDNESFPLLREEFDSAIRKIQRKQNESSSVEKTDKEIAMENFENLKAKLKYYHEISPQIMFSAILCNLSYYYPYNETQIISDIVKNHTLYVVFTGTQPTIRDMTFNVDIFKTHIFGGRIHSGFHKRAIDYFKDQSFEIWFNDLFKNAQLKNKLKEDDIKEIVFTGHSLGGAASEIIGTYFWKHCNKNNADEFCSVSSQIITFGAPLTFQKSCNVHPHMTHIVNDNDMIPRILRDFEFLYSGTFTIKMLWPRIPHVFALTVFLSMLSIKHTTYDWIQIIFACSMWILMIFHWFSTESVKVNIIQYVSPILNWLGDDKIFCEYIHHHSTYNFSYWEIHFIMVIILVLKRFLVEVFTMENNICRCCRKVAEPIHHLLEPFIDIIPFFLRIIAIFVPCFVGICFIAPHYYGEGNIIHIQRDHRCNILNATDFYENMRTGYQESFFLYDHSIVNYTQILQSLVEDNIICGNKLPHSSTGQEVEDIALLLMFIICIAFCWIHFIRKVMKPRKKPGNKQKINDYAFIACILFVGLLILLTVKYGKIGNYWKLI